jgi:outer membrane protein assembly factor BamB
VKKILSHTGKASPRRGLVILAALAFLLAGCGVGPLSWPGLLVDGDTAYLAFSNHISAVNLADGSMLWQYPAKDKKDAALQFYSDPILDSDGNLVAGSYDGSIVKVDTSTGNLVWRNTDNKHRIIAPVLQGPDGKYYFSPEDAGLAVLQSDDGADAGQITLDGGASSWGVMAAEGENIVVATLEHKVISWHVTAGEADWIVDLGAPIAGGIRLEDGTLYLGTFNNNAVALDPGDGSTIWEVPTKAWVWQPPVVQDGVAYILDVAGNLTAVNAADGSVIWTAALDGPSQASPVVDAETGIVYVGQTSGKVRAFSIADGKSIWEVELSGPVYGTLQISGDRLLVPVLGGEYHFASLLKTSGAKQWTYTQPTD